MTSVVHLRGPLGPDDAAAFAARGLRSFGGGRGPVILDVGGVTGGDIATVDALARLRLLASRLGRTAWLRHVAPELLELIELVGLSDVLRVEPLGQPEEREQAGGVQEEADPADPIV